MERGKFNILDESNHMKFPPGYGYPSRCDWETRNRLSPFDRAVILTFQVLAIGEATLIVGAVGFCVVKGFWPWG